jgi:hypothetical protein
VVRMLLDKGPDVNAQGGRYSNALQAASWGGHEKVVQMLLDMGADVNAQGGRYSNALEATIRSRRTCRCSPVQEYSDRTCKAGCHIERSASGQN